MIDLLAALRAATTEFLQANKLEDWVPGEDADADALATVVIAMAIQALRSIDTEDE